MQADNTYRGPSSVDFIKHSFTDGVGIMPFALVCTQTTFFLYRSLRQPSLHIWRVGVVTAMTGIAIVSFSIMMSGYFSFGELLEPGALKNVTALD